MNFGALNIDFKTTDTTVLVGEIGVNHNGDENLLFKLIDKGIEAGIDILKFQRFVSEDEISKFAESTQYQLANHQADTQLEMAKKLELSDEQLLKAKIYCDARNVGFLCTGFDFGSVDFIADKLKCEVIKVPSPEITNTPMLEYIAKKFGQIVLSTGASNIAECARAVEIFDKHELVLLHCVSEYPAPFAELNLNCVTTLSKTFGHPCGFSDHTDNILAPVVAASIGAVMIEKHYTIDKNFPGPDHAASATVEEMAELKQSLIKIKLMKGSGVKRVAPSEVKNQNLIRKSITCSVDLIEKGTILTKDKLAIKRPFLEGAVAPFDLNKILGKQLKFPKEFDQPILWSDLS